LKIRFLKHLLRPHKEKKNRDYKALQSFLQRFIMRNLHFHGGRISCFGKISSSFSAINLRAFVLSSLSFFFLFFSSLYTVVLFLPAWISARAIDFQNK